MADGIKVSANVFRQAGLSIEQFTSLVGTATSATQLSGNVVARALRTVLLNLQGVTSEVGETTEETISKAEEVLNRYGVIIRDSVGEFRDPMLVFADISEKFQTTLKDNEVAQSEIIQRLAGKKQANILASIIGNWEMVEKQQLEAMYSLGSAMKENEIYMNSWEAKTKQLSTAIVQLWQSSLNTNTIKAFIDAMGKIVNLMARTGGIIPIVAGALTAILIPAIIKLSIGIKALRAEFTALNVVSGGIPILVGAIVTGLAMLGFYAYNTSKGINNLNTALIENTKQEIEVMKAEKDRLELVDKMTNRLEELVKKQDRTKTETNELKIITEKLNELYPDLEISVDNITDSYKDQITQINKLTQAEKENLNQKLEMKKIETELQLLETEDSAKKAKEKLNEARKKYEAGMTINEMRKSGKSYEDIPEKLFTDIGLKKSSATRPTFSRYIPDIIEDYTKEYFELSKQTQSYDLAVKTLQEIDDQLVYLKTGFPGRVRSDLLVKDPFKDDSSANVETSMKYTESLRKIQIDLFEKEKLAVKDLNRELEINKNLLNTTADDEEKQIKFLQERLKLLKQMTAFGSNPLTVQAEAQRNRIETLIGELRNRGVNVDYSRAINRLDFTNWQEVIGGYSSMENIEEANRILEILENTRKEIEDLNNSNSDLGTNWKSSNLEIIETTKKIESLQENLKDQNKELISLQVELAESRIEAIKNAEEEIQEIVKKGVEMRKDALKDELNDYENYINKKIAEKNREFQEEDYQSNVKKLIEERQVIQDKINQIQYDTSLKGQSELKKLQEEAISKEENLKKLQTEKRRDLEIESLENSLELRKNTIEEELNQIDQMWNPEKIRIEAREALINKSFENLKNQLPEIFNTLNYETGHFFRIFENYRLKFTESTSMMANNFKDEIYPMLKTAVEYANRLNELKSQIDVGTKIKTDQPISNVNWETKLGIDSSLTRIKSQMDSIYTFWEQGVASDSQISQYKNLKKEYDRLKLIQTSTLGSFSQGLDAGLITKTGNYMLHGTQNNPEWVMNTKQMYNFVKNMSANALSFAKGNLDSMNYRNIDSGINLAIHVNGSADANTVNDITNAGKNIVNQIKKVFNKNGIYR